MSASNVVVFPTREQRRPRRRRDVRSITENTKRIPKRELVFVREMAKFANNYERPVTRGDCAPVSSACPWCGISVVMVLLSTGAQDDDRSHGKAVWDVDGSAPGGCGASAVGEHGADLAHEVRLRSDESCARGESSKQRDGVVRLHANAARNVRDAGIQRVVGDALPLHESAGGELEGLRRPRDLGLPGVDGRRRLSVVLSEGGSSAEQASFTRSHRQHGQLRADERALGNAVSASEEQAHVACPRCRRRVAFRGRVGGGDGPWEKHVEGAATSRLEREESGDYASELHRCRPCVRVSCRWNLYLDVHPRTGNVKKNFPDLEPESMPAKGSCALDVADRGGTTLERAGELSNITRERVRQLEVVGMAKLKLAGGAPFAEHADGERAPRGRVYGSPDGREGVDELPPVLVDHVDHEEQEPANFHVAVGPLGTGFTRKQMDEIDEAAARIVDRMYGGVRLRDALRWESETESTVESSAESEPLHSPRSVEPSVLLSASEPEGAKAMGKQKVTREDVVAYVEGGGESGRTVDELLARFGWSNEAVAHNAMWNHQRVGAPLVKRGRGREGRWFIGESAPAAAAPVPAQAAAPKPAPAPGPRPPKMGGGTTPANDTPLVSGLRAALADLEADFQRKAAKLREVIADFGGAA
jgi:DNA-directed RNA polymerase subunit RPC12/RpoP